mgnify:CR=1 FL=1|tara:strand:- start:23306 stop:23839 length:534 start_codon:yes stop_codon:yes gene_type:complete
MYYLNRLRGTHSWWAKIIAIFLGLAFGFTTWNPYIGVAVAVGYLAGESMAWGEWIGGLIRKYTGVPNIENPRRDGLKYGIQWIATKFYDLDTTEYHFLSLAVRGFYWWFLTLVSLYYVMNPFVLTVGILLLSVGFPLSVKLGCRDLEGKDAWNEAEYYYGGMQDIILIFLIGALLWI